MQQNKARYSSNCIISFDDYDNLIISFKINDHNYIIEPVNFSPVDGMLFGKVMRDDKDTKNTSREIYKFKHMYGEKYGRLMSLKSQGNFIRGKFEGKEIIGFFVHGYFELYDMNAFLTKSNEYAQIIKRRSQKLFLKLKRCIAKLV